MGVSDLFSGCTTKFSEVDVIMVKKGITMKSSTGKLVLGWALLSTSLLGTGCASFTSVSLSVNRGDKVVSMTSNINKEYRFVKHVKIQQKVPLLFLARVNPQGGSPDLDELLQPEFAETPGDAIVNVKIKGEAALGDVILPVGMGIVGAFVFPPLLVISMFPLYEDLKTYTVEGDIVKYVGEQLPPGGEKLPPAVDKPTPVVGKLPPVPVQRIDPETGLPVKKPVLRFDPSTGLPVKEE